MPWKVCESNAQESSVDWGESHDAKQISLMQVEAFSNGLLIPSRSQVPRADKHFQDVHEMIYEDMP